MFRDWILSAVLLALAAPAFAAPPKVGGPYKAAVCEVIEVEVEGKEIGFHNPHDVKDLFVREATARREGTKAFIIQAKVAGVYRLTVWTGGELVGATLVIDATGVGPGPKPIDPVVPTPQPDGRLGLIKVSREGLAAVGYATKMTDAVKLAKAQRGIASAIAAGGITEPAAILSAWRDANRATVDGKLWKPWGDVTSAAMAALYKDGKLPDKAAWIEAFNELASGLDGGN